jgi:hypothetical protein
MVQCGEMAAARPCLARRAAPGIVEDAPMLSWDVLLFTFGLTAFVLLFMGPVLWSSDNEFVYVKLWRRLRGKPPPETDGAEAGRRSADPRAR